MTNYLTIDGFEKLSKQELLDMSAAHIGQTRQKSMNSLGSCEYDGIGCGAAPFLKRECRAIADKGAGDSSWYALHLNRMVPKHEEQFVSLLQECHDRSPSGPGFVCIWKFRARNLAAMYSLSTASIDAIPD